MGVGIAGSLLIYLSHLPLIFSSHNVCATRVGARFIIPLTSSFALPGWNCRTCFAAHEHLSGCTCGPGSHAHTISVRSRAMSSTGVHAARVAHNVSPGGMCGATPPRYAHVQVQLRP